MLATYKSQPNFEWYFVNILPNLLRGVKEGSDKRPMLMECLKTFYFTKLFTQIPAVKN
ncbi:hypothetical protein DOY81_013014 [Sarcophaga bullata]|nr:hypothetical protein DOY81_013014 [Sarcophaga bullata]